MGSFPASPSLIRRMRFAFAASQQPNRPHEIVPVGDSRVIRHRQNLLRVLRMAKNKRSLADSTYLTHHRPMGDNPPTFLHHLARHRHSHYRPTPFLAPYSPRLISDSSNPPCPQRPRRTTSLMTP